MTDKNEKTNEINEIDEFDINTEIANKYEEALYDFNIIQKLFSNQMNLIKETADEIIPSMLEKDRQMKEKVEKLIINLNEELKKSDDDIMDLIKDFLKQIKNTRIRKSSDVIIKSLFLNIFSEFDSFLNNLLKHIFLSKPDLIKASQKKFSLHEIMEHKTIEEFKNQVIDKEIDSLIRKSYIEQFNQYEKKFGVNTLKKFKNWGKFVEITQRRNIIMHCNGKVTSQYFQHCDSHSCLPDGIEMNDKLDLEYSYLIEAIRIVNEVGNKLLHVLWRKQFPEEIDEANVNLQSYLYDLLLFENYELARVMGEFACNLKKYPDKIDEYLVVINYSIALKHLGHNDKLVEIINKYDWTSVKNEFQLAKHILLDETDEIKDLIIRIGKGSDILKKDSYLEFPIFDFINDEQYFKEAFFEVFNTEYEKELLEKEILEKDISKNEVVEEEIINEIVKA